MISESRPYGYYSLLHTPRDANKQYLALAYIARYESIKYEHGDGTLEELEKAINDICEIYSAIIKSTLKREYNKINI